MLNFITRFFRKPAPAPVRPFVVRTSGFKNPVVTSNEKSKSHAEDLLIAAAPLLIAAAFSDTE